MITFIDEKVELYGHLCPGFVEGDPRQMMAHPSNLRPELCPADHLMVLRDSCEIGKRTRRDSFCSHVYQLFLGHSAIDKECKVRTSEIRARSAARYCVKLCC
jgi:hypothetical protein